GMKYVMQDDIALMGEGLFWLNAAADQNDAEALRVLSALSSQGRGVDQSEEEAYKYMRRAADLGSPEAQYELAMMLANGKGMPRDTEAALIWARKAAERGNINAQMYVGRELIASIEQERKNEGAAFLQKAAEAGQAQAALFLAGVFSAGQFGLAKDEKRAEQLLLPAAEQGNADCQFMLAVLYQNGEAFADRRDQVHKWLSQSAKGGNAKAIEALQRANKPVDVVQDEGTYEDVATGGDAETQRRLGKTYVEEAATPELLARGVELLKSAAAKDDAEALFILARLAATGRGMDQSDTEAFQYMSRAAELGPPAAQYELANMLADGIGTPRDAEAAMMWGRKAAEQGYAPAQMALGRALISSVEQERKDEAIDLLRKAAEAGQADAVIFLATAIGKGEYGLRKDETYAEALLKPWAEKGNADCQFVLAALYKFGDSFPDRRKDAQIWLQRAADQNHSRALEVLKSEEQ
ncbi:MAG: tetratricopeptide repeat protein, partial [Chthoniobacterales bacterium]